MNIIAQRIKHEKSLALLRLMEQADMKERNIREWQKSIFNKPHETAHALEINARVKQRLMSAYQKIN